jgi:hypothetical protein
MTDIIWMRGVNKARRLLTINCLYQSAMEKSILHIHLMNRPVMRESHRKNHPDGSWLDSRAKSFTIVHPMLLSKTTEDPLSFVAIKSTIRKKLMPEHPFATNHISVGWPRNKGLSVVGLQGCELLRHGIAPIRIGKGTMICLGQGC